MPAWKKWLNSRTQESAAEAPMVLLDQVRLQLHGALDGCDGAMAERVRWHIDQAYSSQDLWLLRGDIYQLVADQFCQAEAVRRINALLPAFSGQLPGRMLAPIQG